MQWQVWVLGWVKNPTGEYHRLVIVSNTARGALWCCISVTMVLRVEAQAAQSAGGHAHRAWAAVKVGSGWPVWRYVSAASWRVCGVCIVINEQCVCANRNLSPERPELEPTNQTITVTRRISSVMYVNGG